jgi:hypothetical protein
MLSDTEIHHIADKMGIKCLEGCYYKDDLPAKFETNKAYIINLQDSTDEGNGTHFTCLYSQKNLKEGNIDYIYMDSTGISPPNEVLQFTNQPKIPYNTKNFQGSNNQFCGWACVAFIYYLTTFPNRTKHLYADTENFLFLFDDDLNDKIDLFKNEYILSQFFKEDPKLEKAIEKGTDIEVDEIITSNSLHQ